MRGYYKIKPFAYIIHKISVRLVELIEAPSDKYMSKDRSHGSGLINLYPGSRVQLMDPQESQKNPYSRDAKYDMENQSISFTGYVSIRIRVTIIVSESSHRCTTSFNCRTRDRCLTSDYEPGACLNTSYNQCFYRDTPVHPCLHHPPDQCIGGERIWNTRSITVL